MKYLLGVFLTALTALSHAVLVTDVSINYVGIYGNGDVFASFDKIIPVAGCATTTWIVIPSNHQQKDEIYSMLLTAYAGEKKLDVSASICHSSNAATLVDSTSNYILVK